MSPSSKSRCRIPGIGGRARVGRDAPFAGPPADGATTPLAADAPLPNEERLRRFEAAHRRLRSSRRTATAAVVVALGIALAVSADVGEIDFARLAKGAPHM